MTTPLLHQVWVAVGQMQTVWDQQKKARGERWEKEDGEEYNEVA